MLIEGRPNYLAASAWFDGGDYSLIELGEGCTVSINVSVLTHDWSLFTIGRGMGLDLPNPTGIQRPVKIGRYAFIGACSVLLPGADIGDGALVGAGSVVRGKVPPWSVTTGNPAQVVGDSREYLIRYLRKRGLLNLADEVEGRWEKDRLEAGAEGRAASES
jgi:carbonic anhydrase/acetyltransferase-like protein (isoleucine patch superfamily)